LGAPPASAQLTPLKVFPEDGVSADALAPTMALLEYHHEDMLSRPPRVWSHPVMGPNNLIYPAGWTGGIDDPSMSSNASLHQSWTNLANLAYGQHVYRQERQAWRHREARRQQRFEQLHALNSKDPEASDSDANGGPPDGPPDGPPGMDQPLGALRPSWPKNPAGEFTRR
ncbi:MAG: hypothetical protein Q8R28_05815, partial [Dehalococcoidia bacterium]|nr:hypothetical protein [Dehalococcoidia bacterium]